MKRVYAIKTRSGKRRRIIESESGSEPESPTETTLDTAETVPESDSDSESVPDSAAESEGDSSETLGDTDSDSESLRSQIFAKMFGGGEKINRAKEDFLEELPTDWREGFENEEEAEEYRATLEKYVAHYNSVPTIGEIMKIPRIPEEERRELIDMRLSLDNPELVSADWRKIRNRLKLRVDYHTGKLQEGTSEYREAAGSGNRNIYQAIISAQHVTQSRKNFLLDMYRELAGMSHENMEAPKIEQRIRTALKLNDGVIPPRPENPIKILQNFRQTVDSQLYGLEKPKEEMLCFLNGHITSSAGGCVLGMESAPGMGKTSLAIAMAEAMGCGWYKIPMGSLTDSSQLTGGQPVHLGSTPGLIVDALKSFNNSGGVLILDEADKINSNSRESSAIFAALLEILDFSQNHSFTDANLQIPLDLSRVIMIVTMNDRTNINPIVLNRIQTIITLDSYSYSERRRILKEIMVPKYLKKYELESCVTFSDSAYHEILGLAPKEDRGMRPPENAVKTILSRIKLYRTCAIGGDMTLVSFTLPDFSVENYTVDNRAVSITAGHLKPTVNISEVMIYQ